MKKRIGIVVLVCLCMVVPLTVAVVRNFPRPAPGLSMANSPAAKLEYNDSGAIETMFLTNGVDYLAGDILSLDLEETEEAVSDWTCKITFNCKEWVPDGPEIVVLLGDHALSIDGTSYTTSGEVPFSQVADWMTGKFKYYFETYAGIELSPQ